MTFIDLVLYDLDDLDPVICDLDLQVTSRGVTTSMGPGSSRHWSGCSVSTVRRWSSVTCWPWWTKSWPTTSSLAPTMSSLHAWNRFPVWSAPSPNCSTCDRNISQLLHCLRRVSGVVDGTVAIFLHITGNFGQTDFRRRWYGCYFRSSILHLNFLEWRIFGSIFCTFGGNKLFQQAKIGERREGVASVPWCH